MAKLAKRFSEALAAGHKARKRVEISPPQTDSKLIYSILVCLNQTVADTQKFVTNFQKEHKNRVVILLTDRPDIELFQLPSCITEHLISLAELEAHGSKKSAKIYIAQRLNILSHKWRPVSWHPYDQATKNLLDDLAPNNM